MAENNFSGVIESLMKGMNAVIGTKTVVGDATQVGDTIILPLVDVSFGVGAGAGTGTDGKKSTTKLVNIKNQDTVTKVLDMIPDIVEKFTSPKEEMLADDAAVDIAFPEENK